MWYNIIFVGLFISPAVAHADFLCVYPLSGVYAPLQRILFYLLLAFGVLGRRQRWLIAGALASAMSYGGSAAVHSILLLTKVRSQSVDLDTYGVFAVTSTAVMLTGPLLAWSTTLHTIEKEVRTIVLLWGAFVAIGAVLAVTSIYIKNSLPAPVCLPSTANVSSVISSIHDVAGDCFYACFSEQYPLFRAPGDILAWKNMLDSPGQITGVFLPTIAGSIPSTIITWVWIRRRGKTRAVNQLWISPAPLKRLELGWILGWVFERRRRRTNSFARVGSYDERHPPTRRSRLWDAFQYYAIIASFGGFVVNIALNEVRFRSLPTNEMNYEVGQWSPWVGVALVVLAQILHQSLKRVWPEKRADEEEEMRIRERTEDGDGWRKEVGSRTSTFRSERRRRSF